MNDDTKISLPVAKATILWGMVGISTWADAAAAAACIYSLLLIGEWFWKKVWRPMLVRRGYLAGGNDDSGTA